MKPVGLFFFILMCFAVVNVFGQMYAYERLKPSIMWGREDKIAILAEAEKFAKDDTENKNSIRSLIEKNNGLRVVLDLELNIWDEPVTGFIVIQPNAYPRLSPANIWNKNYKKAIIAEIKGFAEAAIEYENQIKRLQKENDVFGLIIFRSNLENELEPQPPTPAPEPLPAPAPAPPPPPAPAPEPPPPAPAPEPPPPPAPTPAPPPPPTPAPQPPEPTPTPAPTAGNNEQLVPITRELIKAIENNRLKLDDLHYYLSAPLQLVTNSLGTRSDIANGRLITINETSRLEPLTIEHGKDWGKLNQNSGIQKNRSGEIESFEIIFQEKRVIMTFRWNNQKNIFDLESARDVRNLISPVDYRLPVGNNISLPYLCIYSNYKAEHEGFFTVSNIPPAQINRQQEQNNANNTLNIKPPEDADRPNARAIEGRGSLEKSSIVAYIRSKNPAAPSRDLENLIDAYIREAQRENINHDIAIAQMCYATDYMRNKPLMDVHNYAGFDAVNRVAVKYSNMNEGVKAHIQHLKGYASRERPQGTIIDKRYQILVDNKFLGTIKTVDALYEKWAPANSRNYGNRMDSILKELYAVAARR